MRMTGRKEESSLCWLEEEPWRRQDFSRMSESQQNTQVYKVRSTELYFAIDKTQSVNLRLRTNRKI